MCEIARVCTVYVSLWRHETRNTLTVLLLVHVDVLTYIHLHIGPLRTVPVHLRFIHRESHRPSDPVAVAFHGPCSIIAPDAIVQQKMNSVASVVLARRQSCAGFAASSQQPTGSDREPVKLIDVHRDCLFLGLLPWGSRGGRWLGRRQRYGRRQRS